MSAPWTPGPWAIHSHFPTIVVRATDAVKKIGFSDNPDQEAAEWAKVIHQSRHDDPPPEFYRSRVMRREALANAALIALSPEWPEVMEWLANEAYWVNTQGCDGFTAALAAARALLARLPKETPDAP